MTDHSHIGRTLTESDLVSPRLVRSFRATLGASLATVDEKLAPAGLHWCLAPDLLDAAELGEDGARKPGTFLPPVDLPRRLWAASDVTFHAALRVGDEVKRVSTLVDVAHKAGKSGSLVFATVEHVLWRQDEKVLTERQTLAYAGKGAVAAPHPSPLPPGSEAVQADAVLLFRYAALGFNGHRIHYDHPYATTVEGHEGLVVQGALQATWLLNLAIRRRGAWPLSFSFKARQTAVAPSLLHLHAAGTGDDMQLAVYSSTGAMTLEARARW